MEPAFTLGLEEEYLLVDRSSRDIARNPPDEMLEACQEQAPGQIHPEFLRCQIEVGTPVCATLAEARAELARLRATVAGVARAHNLAPIAASTHPFAAWEPQKHTNRDRYNMLARDLGAPARRLMICGMHVHVGIEDDDLRIDLMNQVRYFLPHLLALSTSSPFWRGQDMQRKSYRLAVWNELPRTGMPDSFQSFGEYQQQVNVLVNAGIIEDASKLWWDIRPSQRFPTLEMRITDVCTRLDDAVTVAALFRCLLRMLWRLRLTNVTWRPYKNLLIGENRWRAQRYGLDEGLVDFGRGTIVPYADLMEELIELTREDAERFDCVAEVANARDIIRRGTSAHRQVAIYREALEQGATGWEALAQVVDWLAEETMVGVE
ncbi:carboxylate-amine ligase [Azospirillum brasilense]|uniref:Putative glutamate--cysteine ligase 2 n=1 Tax=Azospirillum brasilense TaxID=192 RepID=A0A0N7I7Y3_AZOBR|nr:MULTISPECIES: carboxylate-amine ligase [Azospirillum]ALJ35771.1 carboxylate--amine ligase [Azospirillum brasilense]MDW7555043.1 carboxylate-amine ligase [Azospirillum brasilense]MDW7594820.1 carboxylate-amine ligase [Azospirillum brasilense]MDW7629674.1 carboxylate-amine ligase [Azospirillum brasilense]MDX5954534.1 carboxylate-amine ligase [Azospirillum brasilense]